MNFEQISNQVFHENVSFYEDVLDSSPGDFFHLDPLDRSRWQEMVDRINKKEGLNFTLLPGEKDGKRGLVLHDIKTLKGEERKVFISLEKERGITYVEIGKLLGLSRQRVQAIADKKEKRTTGAVLVFEFVRLYSGGAGSQVIAEKFGVSETTVVKWLRKSGVKVKGQGRPIKEREVL